MTRQAEADQFCRQVALLAIIVVFDGIQVSPNQCT